jgi:hypothetical protein
MIFQLSVYRENQKVTIVTPMKKPKKEEVNDDPLIIVMILIPISMPREFIPQ